MRFNLNPLWLALGFSSGFLALPHMAQASEEGMTSLNTVMITATRTERELSEIPASVTIVNQADIERSAAASVDELLQDIAGIDSTHSIGILTTSTSNQVSLRGLGSTEGRTLLLIDGVPANNIYGGSIEWNEVPLTDIDRIEIVRGAASALYGSNAMGGVINIITKQPSHKSEKMVRLGYGTFNTRQAEAALSGKKDKFGLRLSGSVLTSDGYQSLPEAKQKATSIDQGVERENLNATLSYDLTPKSQISLNASHYHEQKTGTLDYDGHNPLEQNKQSLTGKYTNQLKDGANFEAVLFHNTSESDYDSANAATGYTSTKYNSTSKERNSGTGIKYSKPILVSDTIDQTLTMGIDLRDGNIDRFDDYASGDIVKVQGSQSYYGLYLQDELFLGQNLVVNLGGRYDLWKNYDGYGYDTTPATPFENHYKATEDSAFNPKLGLVYHLTESTSFRGSAGSAFRAPTLSDLYRTWVFYSSTYAGNPNLKPETIQSFELGLDQKISKQGILSVTAYRNTIDDYIGYIIPDPVNDPKYRLKDNIGQVSTQGIETEMRFSLNRFWALNANYTWNQSVIEEYKADTSLEGNDLDDTPVHKGALTLSYAHPDKLTAKSTLRHVGERYSGTDNSERYAAYTLVDLHLAKTFAKQYKVSLDVKDLFDRGFTEYYQSPGRTLMAKVQINF